MIRGKDKLFVPGKPFRFLADLPPEERKRNQSNTRRCIDCGKQKKKDHFSWSSRICFKCADVDYSI